MSVSMLSEHLSAAGIYTEVFATTANGKQELQCPVGIKVDVDGVPVTYFKRITKDHTHYSPALLKALWREAKSFDVVHIHAWWNLVSILSCLITLLRKVPVVVSPRGTLSLYSFKNKNNKIKWLIHELLGKPLLNHCHIHVTSRQEGEVIAAITKNRGITMIPNFVKLRSGSSIGNNSSDNIFKCIFLSRVDEKKGLDLLIKALPLVNCTYSLTIAGGGDAIYITDLKSLAMNNGSDSNINWLGFQQENKFDLLAEHDLLILPSYDENFGNVVIESLSEGTAVLISNFVGLVDYVTANNLGWTCDLNPTSIAGMINLISKNKTELSRIRNNAPGQIGNDFNEQLLVQRYGGMYKEVLKNR